MGLFSQLFSRHRHRSAKRAVAAHRHHSTVQRQCAFEMMEPRRLLSATPLSLGAVYLEEDLGSDLHGDRFEITFQGGAPGTELTRLTISGDQNAPGFNVGDVFFDTQSGGLGADHAIPFTLEQLTTRDPNASVTAHVQDGQSLLVLDFAGFQAGDRLVFSIDVDEVEFWDPVETDLQLINDGFDPITSGVEFQSSQLTAEFSAPHYHDADGSGIFWNRYDSALARSGLTLPADDDGGLRDRSTGAFLDAQQEVDPAAISGYVFADYDNDGIRDAGETGISGVPVQVIPVNTIEPQQTRIVNTDTNGFYEAAGLMPGSYRVVEITQPTGYLDGLDAAGTVGGATIGHAVNPGDQIEDIFLAGGTQGVEYNFGEIEPTSIEGNVHLSDSDGNCWHYDGTTTPLPDVKVQLLDEQGGVLAETRTDPQGHYRFNNLAPGTYSVIEWTPSGLIDAGAQAGLVGTEVRGQVIDENTILNVDLMPGEHGQQYDFCEHLPASISGYVYHDSDNDAMRDPSETPIPGTSVTLVDQNGTQIGVATTDSDGHYLFTGLSAGTYTLLETQPASWLDGKESVGQVDGSTTGQPGVNDTLQNVALRWGSEGVEYNFGELLPGSIAGRVHVDLDHDCVKDPNELPLQGVTIELLDTDGRLLATTQTDQDGRYHFDDLVPGQYGIRELQPEGYFQGSHHAGSNDGDDSVVDLVSAIPIGSGQDLINYDFCEIPPGSISGIVYVDPNYDEVWQPSEQLLAGVEIQLLDRSGNVVDTMTTDSRGYYEFTHLFPGQYGVSELQPSDYLHGGQQAGSNGGDDSVRDRITSVAIGAGQDLVEYNFSELTPGSISGYVFQDGETIWTLDGKPPADLQTVRNGQRTADDHPIEHVVLELRDGLTGQPILADQALAGIYPSGPIRTLSDASGYYHFDGLARGNYAIYEVQPTDYLDGIDTPGSTSGLAFNVGQPVNQTILQTLSENPRNDAIVRIPLAVGQQSMENNFSEVRVNRIMIPPPPPNPPVPPPPIPPTMAIAPPMPIQQTRPGIATLPTPIPTFGTSSGLKMTWHLSVIDGGLPRTVDQDAQPQSSWFTVAHLNHTQWVSASLTEGQWVLPATDVQETATAPHRDVTFGIPGAIPVSGDFNGDGVSEIGLFYQGQWFVDLNGNGRWDEDDLWARLGSEFDLPVVGDWDGDGKDDIGIFGPEWHGDQRAIKAEPGLPDPENVPNKAPKNLPPQPAEATNGQRVLQRSAEGNPRLDLIDHVFEFGVADDVPVSGDWNGDGINSIGVFRSGRWYLDMDGDGRFTERDMVVHYGAPGDAPVVGDFNGDGIDDVGIYRIGTWHLDSDGNHHLDAHDRVFQMGGAQDTPVVGDWDGDGTDDPALYRDAG